MEQLKGDYVVGISTYLFYLPPNPTFPIKVQLTPKYRRPPRCYLYKLVRELRPDEVEFVTGRVA